VVVLLPRPGAFGRLAQRRAPRWAAILPAIILTGTFGPITLPPVAQGLALGVVLVSPFVALMAAVSAARRRLLVMAIAFLVVPAAIAHVATISQLALGLMTALACISVGVALERLIPRAWLLPAVMAMSALDVAFLACGIAAHQDVLLAAATRGVPGFTPTGVQLGTVYVGYPDLFLAALLGASLAGDRRQLWAAGLVLVLTLALETLLVPGETLPATLPLALTLLLITLLPLAGRRFRVARRAREPRRHRSSAALPTSRPATASRS
jgi:hypothetical protein